MDASEFLCSLKSSGFTVRAVAGKLLVKPFSLLTANQKCLLADLRDDLLKMLGDAESEAAPPPGHLSDATIDALAARAHTDPPDFSAGQACLRDSVVLHLPGCPPVAMDPTRLEAIAAWNASVEAIHRKAQKQEAAPADAAAGKPVRKPRKATQTTLTPDHSADRL